MPSASHTRRAFLQAGALSVAGLSLADLLELKAAPAFQAKRSDLAVILLWMDGGPSHLDTFDLKPHAPLETRGEFQAIQTAQLGVRICEHLPLTARVLDRVTVLRSLHHQDNLHEGAIHWVQTGYGYPRQFDPVNARAARNPAAGAVVAQQSGPVRPGMPAYVKLFRDGGYEHSYQGAVYLGRKFEPLPIGSDIRQTAFREAEPFRPQHFQAPALVLPSDITATRLENRRGLAEHLASLDE